MGKIFNQIKTLLCKNKKITIISLVLLVIVIISGIFIYSNIQKNRMIEKIKIAQELKNNNSELYYEVAGDFVLGDSNAAVTIIEYASLSCPHCASFYHEVFDKIEKNYIDKGKVKFIYRDFPLNKSALFASIISQCKLKADNNIEKYYKFVKVLFKNQESWAFSEDLIEKLKSLANLNGISAQQFENCVNDEKLVDNILQKRMKSAKELKIKSTPTFIINGKLIKGYHNFDNFKEVIEAEL